MRHKYRIKSDKSVKSRQHKDKIKPDKSVKRRR